MPPEYVDFQPPSHILPNFTEVYQFCARLNARGWRPDYVIDVGASTGIWSGTVSEVFTDAKFLLCDPLFESYAEAWEKPCMERVKVAIADKPGELMLSVSKDLYGSSLVAVENKANEVKVQVSTVDILVTERGLTGRCLLKADVQFAEHLVIAGAMHTLKTACDFIILELTVPRVTAEARTLLEMSNWLDDLGFCITDIVGSWRAPSTGEIKQLDVAFMRKDLKLGPVQ